MPQVKSQIFQLYELIGAYQTAGSTMLLSVENYRVPGHLFDLLTSSPHNEALGLISYDYPVCQAVSGEPDK